MISRLFRNWPSRLLAILVMVVLILVVKENLDNRIYIGNVAETEVPLALNGDLALAHSFGAYFVHEASTGTTASLPDIRMPSEVYMPVPTCAAGDEIILERATKELYNGSFLFKPRWRFDRFRWSRSGLELIVSDEFSEFEDLVKLDPWTCAFGPETEPDLSPLFVEGNYVTRTASELVLHNSSGGEEGRIGLPVLSHGGDGLPETREVSLHSPEPAAEPGRFLFFNGEYGVSDGRKLRRFVILDHAFTTALQVFAPEGAGCRIQLQTRTPAV